MKKELFVVCDLETPYVLKLMEFIQKRQGASFEVQAFTSVKSLCEFAKKRVISLLLISNHAMCEEIRKLPIEEIMILSEGERLEELEEYPCVYKYQASDSLISEVMGHYAVEKKTVPIPLLKNRKRMIGVYSPIKRALKTSFALTLGQILAREYAVLYINLESYSGFSWLFGKEYAADISDLMYFVKRGYGSLIYKLQGTVQNIGNLDYIPPALSPLDIRSVVCEEWQAMLGDIERYSSYEIVILDLGEVVDGFPELLRQCDRIYMPVREDGLSVAKLRQFEKWMQMAGYEDLNGRIRKLKLPFHNSFGQKEHYVEQLVWSELGDFVRKLLKEEQEIGQKRTKQAGDKEKTLRADGTEECSDG